MNLNLIVEAVGPVGLVLMVVSFIAVVWWGFRGRG